ncbi:MAG: histidine kinase [Crocinitomicaceae bacterium]|nr:histidine kinase [Crocinitomicaceae bacterium]
MRKKQLYIASQLIGWSVYFLIALFLNQSAGVPIDGIIIVAHLTPFFLGILLSHAYREIIIRNNWLQLSIIKLIPRFVIGSLIMASVFELLFVGVMQLIQMIIGSDILVIDIIQDMVSWTILFILWSVIYFFYHFFKNYKAEEIKNLRWEATKNETELNKLKSQLNPHFMFNSMNTIRALIDENPKKAKLAVTQLSNILRSNLLMGQQKLIPLEKEIKLVRDYLAVESYRYEERLSYNIDVHPESKGIMVPPLMIQTLVENGIKHGISKLPLGGEINLSTSVTDNELEIKIMNSGQYNSNAVSKSGFGIANTRERLKILYGSNAEMSIKNYNGNQVLTEVYLPKSQENEVKDNNR